MAVWLRGCRQICSQRLLANGQDETFSEHFNDITWAVVPMPMVNSSNIDAFFQFNGIKANGASDVWAVGGSGVAGSGSGGPTTLTEHFNGTAWIAPRDGPGASRRVAAARSDLPTRRVRTVRWEYHTGHSYQPFPGVAGAAGPAWRWAGQVRPARAAAA
jgi:hypothetical protein